VEQTTRFHDVPKRMLIKPMAASTSWSLLWRCCATSSNAGTRRLIRMRRNVRIHVRGSPSSSDSLASSLRYLSTWSVDRRTGIVTSSTDADAVTNGATYQTIIGLEIHARLTACPTKLFSSSPNGSAAAIISPSSPSSSSSSTSLEPLPNTMINPQDLAYPGTLPRLSQTAIRHAILSIAALNCKVNTTSRFERKHYFWHDLPHGYQITQQRWPLGGSGTLRAKRGVGTAEGRHQQKKKGNKKNKKKDKQDKEGNNSDEGSYFDVGIDRVQVEIDTAKTTTVTNGNNNTTTSLIDLNRAGAPLIEIVFQPTIRSSSEAADAVETVRKVLKFAGTCDGRMESGNLRVDLNVSVAKILDGEEENGGGNETAPGNDDAFDPANEMYASHLPSNVGQRTEVKNLNSLRQVVASAEYEAVRQVAATEAAEGVAGSPGRETRTFDPKTQRTVRIRDKGGAVDYRFMPEPDLPPVVLNERVLDGMTLDEYLCKYLPESPDMAMKRLGVEYALDDKVAAVLTTEPEIVRMYEDTVRVAAEEIGTGGSDGKNSKEYRRIASSVSNWLCNDLFALWKAEEGNGSIVSAETSPVDASRLGSLVAAMHDNTLSTPMGKKVLSVMYNEEPSLGPREIAEFKGWRVITDMEELQKLCRDIICEKSNEKQLEQYKSGGRNVKKMSKFFLGKIMAASRGNAHPGLAAEALDHVLDEVAPDARGR